MAWSKSIWLYSVIKEGISRSQYYAMGIQYLSMAVSLLNVFLISNIYGFESVGIFVFYLSAQQIVGFAATLGVGAYSIRVLSRSINKRRTIILLGQHAFLIIIIWLIALIVNHEYGFRDNLEFGLLLLATWFGLIRFILEDVCVGVGWFVRSSLIAMIENSVRLVMLLFVGVGNSRDALFIIIFSTAVAVVIIGYAVVKKCFYDNSKAARFAFIKIYYLNAFMMFSSHFTSLLQNRLGVLTAPQFLSSAEVGVFALLLTLSEVALRIGGMIARYVYALGSKRIIQDVRARPLVLVSVATFIGSIISSVMLIFFPILSTYMYNGALDGYIYEFGILCLYACIFLFVNLSSNLLYGRGASGDVLMSSLCGVAISIFVIAIAWYTGSLIVLCFGLTAGALMSSLLNVSTLRKKIISDEEVT